MARKPWAEDFWSLFRTDGECLIWSGPGQMGERYPKIRVGGRLEKIHRIAWTLSNGPVPLGMKVLHRCDRTHCVRPTHLFLGTQTDNIADMDAKGRRGHTRGRLHSKRPGAKSIRFSPEIVAEGRRRAAKGATAYRIAQDTGLQAGTIWQIIHRKTRKNLP